MDIREAYWSVLVDTDGETHQTLKSIASQQLNTQLPGDERSELRKVLTPNYPPGCKRILISDDYYPALGKPHVTLKTAAIEKITDEGIRASTGWNSAKGQHSPHKSMQLMESSMRQASKPHSFSPQYTLEYLAKIRLPNVGPRERMHSKASWFRNSQTSL